jgi:hypothetical protein
MKKYITQTMAVLFATIAVSIAATPDKAAMEGKEKAAWQAFKNKNEADFKKVVDKDFRGVYDGGISNMQKELDDMKKWDMKSFEISDYDKARICPVLTMPEPCGNRRMGNGWLFSTPT